MNEQNLSFEQSLARLEKIVQAMESGNITLDESLALFQEGTALIRSCEKLLDEAELRVTKVTAAKDGTPVEEVFTCDGEI